MLLPPLVKGWGRRRALRCPVNAALGVEPRASTHQLNYMPSPEAFFIFLHLLVHTCVTGQREAQWFCGCQVADNQASHTGMEKVSRLSIHSLGRG